MKMEFLGLIVSILVLSAPTHALAASSQRTFVEALSLIKKGSFAEAREALEPLAIKGDPVAQSNMAVFYSEGLGTDRDELTASQWVLKSKRPATHQFLWPDGSVYRPALNINPLRFTNRARCAADSKLPTESVFLLIDGYNAGKLSNSLARVTNQEPAPVISKGEEEFRLAVTSITKFVLESLLSGKLPLIQSQVSLNCDPGAECPALEDFIKTAWRTSSRLSFPIASPLGCYYLKAFSPLQQHLREVKPDRRSLSQIVLANSDRYENIADCSARGLPSRSSVVQFDLLNLRTLPAWKNWKKQGFDFWRSAKAYVSWIWRHKLEIFATHSDFTEAFRSIPIEESVLLVPNGCKSVETPECSLSYLSAQNEREFAKVETGSPDFAKNIPEGPQADLVKDPTPTVNTDILNLERTNSASSWLLTFRNGLAKNRGWALKKFEDGKASLKIIEKSLPAEVINGELKSLLEHPPTDHHDKERIYYLCNEFGYASSPEYGFMNSSFGLFKNILPKGLDGSFTRTDWDLTWSYYESLNSTVQNFCAGLEKNGYWLRPENYSPDGFNEWYKEVSQIKDSQAYVPYRDPAKESVITLESEFSTVSVCFDTVECARLVLKSLIDIAANLNYDEVYSAPITKIQSPDLFNPYAERVACKVYDPWFKAKAALVGLGFDLANTAAFGWNGVPAYVAATIKPGEVTSFSKLIKDGKVELSPHGEKMKIELTGVMDFSTWGIPCAVSYGPTTAGPAEYLLFKGISMGACDSRQANRLEVYTSTDFTPSSKKKNACAACYLNFSAVPRAAAALTNVPYVKGSVYLLAGLVRLFKNLHDPVNMPHTEFVDVNGNDRARFNCQQAASDFIESKTGAPASSLTIKKLNAALAGGLSRYEVSGISRACSGTVTFIMTGNDNCSLRAAGSWAANGDCEFIK